MTFTSSDDKVVTISSLGAVRAIGAGSAKITVAYDGVSTIIPVTIKALPLPIITTNPATIAIAVGATEQLEVLIDGTPVSIASATLTSGDDTIATVDATGLVEGIGAGSTEITVAHGTSVPVKVPVTVA